MPSLDLNTSPRIAVMRQIETILKTNPTLKRVVKTWRTWKEKPGQNAPFGTDSDLPAVRITPVSGPDIWRFPDAMVGPLYLNFEMLLQGSELEDVFNLWYALCNAIYPGSSATPSTQTNISALQTAGANTGLVEFSSPAFDPSPDGSMWLAQGQMKIDVRLQLKN
jgi:hypothetical protein